MKQSMLCSFSFVLSIVSLASIHETARAAQVDQASIARQVAMTTTKRLTNGAIFIQREIPGSDIVHLETNVRFGQQDLPEERRVVNMLTFDVMQMASKKFTKREIFNLTEKHAIGLQCSGGIEQSGCQFETVSDSFDQAFALLASVMTEPSLNQEDIDLARQRKMANFQQEMQNPEQYVNSLVNTVFYPAGHPYRMVPADAMAYLKKVSRKELVDYQKSLLNAQGLQIVYVGPKLSHAYQSKIETTFGQWKGALIPEKNVPSPKFDAKSRTAFEDRPIPTAYIRAKFNAPGAAHEDAAASKVLFEILGEVLHEEVRTKRSLSYSIGATTLQLQEGIGVIIASTSKPKETIETIAQVLKDVAAKPLSDDKLKEYKNVFTTSHYLTLESHDSFAAALASAQFHLGDANKMYEFPAKVAAVTPADVQRLAKSLLKEMRIGIIFDKSKYDDKWFAPLMTL